MMDKLIYIVCLFVIGLTATDALTVAENLTLGRIFFIIMLILSFFRIKMLSVPRVNVYKTLLVFISFCIGSVFWTTYLDTTIISVLYLIQYFLIIVVCYNAFNSPIRVYFMLLSYVLGSVYIAVFSIKDYLSNATIVNVETLYRVEEFGNPNENSFMIVYAFILGLILIHNTKFVFDRNKTHFINSILVIFLVLFVLAIFANGSRMGFIMLVSAIIFSAFPYLKTKSFSSIVFISLLCFIVYYAISSIFQDSTFERFFDIISDIRQGRLSNRDWIWSIAYNMILDSNIIWGNGWGTFANAFKDKTGIFYGAHNFYITLIFTTGIIGFFIVLRYFWQLFLYVRKTHKIYNNTIFYALIVIPLLSMGSTNWEGRRWWFLMGLFIVKIYNLYGYNRRVWGK